METAPEFKNDSQHPHNTIATKSRFRNLFARKRTASDGPVIAESQTRPSSAAASVVEHLGSIQTAELKPCPEAYDRKDESAVTEAPRPQTRPKSRSRRRSPSSPSVVPTSLTPSQACAQASLYSVMQVPTLYVDDRTSSTPGLQPAPAFTGTAGTAHDGNHDGTEVPRHERPTSSPQRRELVSSSVPKLFCLLESGTILQYEASGTADRMPEASFGISLETIVSTKEIISRSFWMLEMRFLKDAPCESKVGSSRSTWTRLSFRSAETKEATCELNIVFNDKASMSTWLNAIRSKIDIIVRQNNELEFQADRVRPKTPSTRKAAGERSRSRPAFLHFSRSTSNLRNELSDTVILDKELPRLPVPSQASTIKPSPCRSITASSVNTVTSLDGLRDSDNGSTTTATTNSLDGSAVLESPIKETFASISSSVIPIGSRFSPSTGPYELQDPLIKQTSCEQDKASFRNTLVRSSTGSASASSESPSSITIGKEPAIFVSGPDGDEDDAQRNEPESAPVSRTRYPERRSSLLPTAPIDINVPPEESEEHYAADGHVRHATGSSIDSHSKPVYSLFPKKLAHEVKVEPLMSLEANRILGLPASPAADHLGTSPAPLVSQPPSSSGSKLGMGKRPSPLQLLSRAAVEQPQRSPAVTDDMLASNFGTLPSAGFHAARLPKKFDVPDLADLCQLLGTSRNTSSGRQDSPERTPSISPNRRSRSIPNLQATTHPPVGPPPRGPLPAIPTTEVIASRSRASSRPKCMSVKPSRQTSPDVSPVDDVSSVTSPFPAIMSTLPKSDDLNNQDRGFGTTTKTTSRTSPSRARKDSFGIPAIVSPLVPSQGWNGKYPHDLRTNKLFSGHTRAKSGSGKSITASIGSISSFDSILGKIR